MGGSMMRLWVVNILPDSLQFGEIKVNYGWTDELIANPGQANG